MTSLRAQNLRTIGLLAALFLTPLLLSFWMYYGAQWRPAGHTNHGQLLTPPIPLERADLFNGKWTLVYVGDGSCDDHCRNALHVMRQTRLALANDMTRVNRLFVATNHCCDRAFLEHEHAGLSIIDASTADNEALAQRFTTVERESSLFIVDPLGNLMMREDARANPKGLLEDLKKLLKLSHIG